MLAAHQKLFYHAKQSTTDALKTASKRETEKTAEAAGDLIDKKFRTKLERSQGLRHRILHLQLQVKQKI